MSLQRFQQADAVLAGALEPNTSDADAATFLARLLFAASQGVANRAERLEDAEQGIRALCQLIDGTR